MKVLAKLINMNRILYGLGFFLFLLFLFLTPTAPVEFLIPTFSPFSTSSNEKSQSQFPILQDRTLNVGLTNVHLQGDEKLTGLDETLGAGVCAFDYDNDSWVDLFMVGGSGQTRFYGKQHWWQNEKGNRLFRNTGNGKFEDVTEKAGLSLVVWGMGCAAADLDNDGDAELVVTSKSENYLYENLGNGKFKNISQHAGFQSKQWSTSISLADYDNDGLLDIYITNYLRYVKGAKTFESHSGFELGKQASFNASLYDGVDNQLWHNQGNLTFSNVASKAGVINESGRSLSSIWFHLDENTWPDLYVLNDAGFPNQLYKNNGNGTFTEVGADYNLNLNEHSATATLGDINNDGVTELSVSSNSGKLHKLYQHSNDSVAYTDKARDLKLALDRDVNLQGWSQFLGDFNNDGWLDQLVVNGLSSPDPLSPKLSQGQKTTLRINSKGQWLDSSFSKQVISMTDSHSSRGAAVADYDHDGDLDVYISNNNDLGQYWENTNPNNQNWVQIRLRGTKSNRDAIGAKVRISFDQGNPEIQHFSSGGFLSQHDSTIHFGLGNQTKPINLDVQWPSGIKQSFNQIQVNQLITLTEGNSNIKSAASNVANNTSEITPTFTSLSNPEKIELLNLIEKLDKKNELLGILKFAIRDQNVDVRKRAIRSLGKNRNTKTLHILLEALEHKDTHTQLAAISALRQREEEHTSRWLLRQFNTDSPELRISLANLYEFFFREEEAVIYRKHLALPFLIQYLSDQNNDVRVAAARALGESESFRAVDALLQQLKNPDVNVRSEAVRALGNIRERLALPSLKSLLFDNNEDALVKAHALIALKRLNYDEFNNLFDRMLPAEINETTTKYVESSIDSLHKILFEIEDGIVIKSNLLTKSVQQWFLNLDDLNKQSLTVNTLKATLQILGFSKNKEIIHFIKPFLSHSDAGIRANCYALMLKLDPAQSVELASKGIDENNDSIKLAIIQTATKLKIQLPLSKIKESLLNPKLRVAALQYIGRKRLIVFFDDTVEIVSEMAITADEKTHAINTLTKLASFSKTLPDEIVNNNEESLRAFAINYWIRQNKNRQFKQNAAPLIFTNAWSDSSLLVQTTAIEALENRRELWALRAIIETASNKEVDIEIRKKAFALYIKQNFVGAQRYAHQLIDDPNEAMRTEAVKIANLQIHNIVDKLWRLLSVQKSPMELRFAIAERLNSINSEKVLITLKEIVQ